MGLFSYLEQGTRNRATGATDMNEKSSRSHAIFSVSLKHEKWVSRSSNPSDKRATRDGEWMVSSSKFHFVDLAGSERVSKKDHVMFIYGVIDHHHST